MGINYNTTGATMFQRLEKQWWQFGAPWLWNCHWDNGFVCPDEQECLPKLENRPEFTCNYVDLHSTPGSYYFKANNHDKSTIGTASTNQRLQLTRSEGATGLCRFGITDCEGNISSPVNNQTIATCLANASVEFSPSLGILTLDKGTAAPEILANVSNYNADSYALFVNETGEIRILGIFSEGDRRVLWGHPAPPAPTSGPCPTDFSNRTLKTIDPDTVNCKCITTARWSVVAKGRSNITGSWCSRLCQADPQYVAAAPRAEGECWCATAETYKATIQASACDAQCLSCPGAPVEPCGIDNTVAIYKWEGDQPSVQLVAILLLQLTFRRKASVGSYSPIRWSQFWLY